MKGRTKHELVKESKNKMQWKIQRKRHIQESDLCLTKCYIPSLLYHCHIIIPSSRNCLLRWLRTSKNFLQLLFKDFVLIITLVNADGIGSNETVFGEICIWLPNICLHVGENFGKIQPSNKPTRESIPRPRAVPDQQTHAPNATWATPVVLQRTSTRSTTCYSLAASCINFWSTP